MSTGRPSPSDRGMELGRAEVVLDATWKPQVPKETVPRFDARHGLCWKVGRSVGESSCLLVSWKVLNGLSSSFNMAGRRFVDSHGLLALKPVQQKRYGLPYKPALVGQNEVTTLRRSLDFCFH